MKGGAQLDDDIEMTRMSNKGTNKEENSVYPQDENEFSYPGPRETALEKSTNFKDKTKYSRDPWGINQNIPGNPFAKPRLIERNPTEEEKITRINNAAEKYSYIISSYKNFLNKDDKTAQDRVNINKFLEKLNYSHLDDEKKKFFFILYKKAIYERDFKFTLETKPLEELLKPLNLDDVYSMVYYNIYNKYLVDPLPNPLPGPIDATSPYIYNNIPIESTDFYMYSNNADINYTYKNLEISDKDFEFLIDLACDIAISSSKSTDCPSFFSRVELLLKTIKNGQKLFEFEKFILRKVALMLIFKKSNTVGKTVSSSGHKLDMDIPDGLFGPLINAIKLYYEELYKKIDVEYYKKLRSPLKTSIMSWFSKGGKTKKSKTKKGKTKKGKTKKGKTKKRN